MLKKIILASALLMLMLSTMFYGVASNRNYYVLEVVDEFGNLVTTASEIDIENTSGTAVAVYSTQMGTTEVGSTGVITTGISDGIIEFWYAGSAIDVTVKNGTYQIEILDFANTDHRIMFPSYVGYPPLLNSQTAVSRTITANTTITDVNDVGRIIKCATDTVVLTLPAVATGKTFTFVNTAEDGAAAIHLDCNASDKILGGCGFSVLDDGDKVTNTKATAKKGDYIKVDYGTADGWYIVELRGTWADGG
jgi:hypothetical protein